MKKKNFCQLIFLFKNYNYTPTPISLKCLKKRNFIILFFGLIQKISCWIFEQLVDYLILHHYRRLDIHQIDKLHRQIDLSRQLDTQIDLDRQAKRQIDIVDIQTDRKIDRFRDSQTDKLDSGRQAEADRYVDNHPYIFPTTLARPL